MLLAEQKVELDLTTEPEKHPKPKLDKPDAIYIHRPNSFEPLMQLRQPEPQEIPKQDYLPKPTYSVYYYLNDHLGTPQELLNKWGELVWQARTSPYGEILKLGKNKIENPIRLPGQYEDKESGLYYNRFRYYSPQDGGYINRDPIGLTGGFNLYDYPRDPVGWVDPFGLYAGEGIRELGKYHSFFDVDLPSSMWKASDPKHFKEANKQLYEAISNNPKLKETLMKKYPGVIEHVQPGPRGGFSDLSPEGMTWHHSNKAGKLELVDRVDHSKYHKIYHPDGSGGKKKWGGGRKKKLSRKSKAKCGNITI